jgi:predicted dehydrogenase
MRLLPSTALDTGTAVVRYESGDEVLVAWSWGLPGGASASYIFDALGPKGVIRFPGSFADSEYPKKFDHGKYGAYLVQTGAKKRLVKFRRNDMFAEEWKDFYRAVTRNAAPKVTGREGRQALAVALAVLKSGASRKPANI